MGIPSAPWPGFREAPSGDGRGGLLVSAQRAAGEDEEQAAHREQHRRTDEGETQRIRRSEEHTSELQSLMRISYAVFCLKKKKHIPMCHTNKEDTHHRLLLRIYSNKHADHLKHYNNVNKHNSP